MTTTNTVHVHNPVIIHRSVSSLTLLTAKGYLLGKTLNRQGDSLVKGEGNRRPKWFSVSQSAPIDSLDDLKSLQDKLSVRCDTYAVRAVLRERLLGDPLKAVDEGNAAYIDKFLHFRRRKETFEDVGSNIVLFDIEGPSVALSKFGTSKRDSWDVANNGYLPAWTRWQAEQVRNQVFAGTPFEKVRCWAGLTSSFGIHDTHRMRLGFILSQPMTSAEILAWMREKNLTVKQGGACDESLYIIPQPCFTAGPRINGGPDPFLHGRSLLTDGSKTPSIVEVTEEMLTAATRRHTRLTTSQPRAPHPTYTAQPNKRTTAPPPKKPTDAAQRDRLMKYGQTALDGEVGKLRSASEGGRGNQTYASAYRMGSIISGNWVGLSEQDIILALTAAASQPDFTETEARSHIENGLRAGQQHPEQKPPSRQDRIPTKGRPGGRRLLVGGGAACSARFACAVYP